MEVIRCYVVRIYRKDHQGMAGVVEDVRTGNSRSFRSSGELWSALSRQRPRPSENDPESDVVKLRGSARS
jgi:hypothetical protein